MLAVLAALVWLASSWHQPPTLKLIADPLAPSPPTAPGFAELPDDGEVRDALKRSYPGASAIELIGRPTGEVVFWREDNRAYWIYWRKSVLWRSWPTKLGFELEERRENALRWEFWSDRWQAGGMWHGEARYRGMSDPEPDQIIALLQQAPMNYHEHNFASTPRDLKLIGTPAFVRDAEGYADLGFPVEYRARVQLADFAESQLHDAEVVLRTSIRLDLREERWRVGGPLQLLKTVRHSSQPSSSSELLHLRWQVERASRR